MAIRVSLSVITGPHTGQTFEFHGRTHCPIGRGRDCLVNLAGSSRDMLISRRHCVLEIEPPQVWVTDLASRNGTFVNGERVQPHQGDTALAAAPTTRHRLDDGDILTVGGTSLRVRIECINEPAPPRPSQPASVLVGTGAEFICCI